MLGAHGSREIAVMLIAHAGYFIVAVGHSVHHPRPSLRGLLALAPDLAGRVLRVLHPTWPIYFQGEMFPDVESSGNVYADEAVLLEKTGSLFHEIAIDLDDDGEIDDREADRVSKAANEARLGIERVLTALSHRRVHAQS